MKLISLAHAITCVFFLNQSIYSMKQENWEIPTFTNFKERYLNVVKTYPELFDATCLDGKENADKIYSENIKETYALAQPVVSQNELLRSIKYAADMIGESISTAPWVDGDPLPKSFFTQDSPTEKFDLSNPEHTQLFAAYEKKILLDDTKGEEIVFFGDLHGGCASLIKALNTYIEPDSFKIKKAKGHTHLAFLGDFVDSGKDGVEVIYLLARIAAANPSHVHLVRGNHEDLKFNIQQLFYQELVYKYGTINPNETFFYNKYQLPHSLYNAITRFYDFMPVALFVGNRRYRLGCFDWRIGCHGGFEVGDINIPELLSHPAKVAYKLVGERPDKKGFQSIIRRETVWNDIKDKFMIDPLIAEEPRGKYYQNFIATCIDFIPLSPGAGVASGSKKCSDNLSIGYCWSLFMEHDNTMDISYSLNLNAWTFGKKATEVLLNRSSTWKNKLVGMIRAHQHTSNPLDYTKYPLMEKILKNQGMWTMWQNLKKQNPASFAAITTLVVAPDTVYGVAKATNNSHEKHYPGVVNYASLTLKPRASIFKINAEIKKEEFTHILPKIYQDKHAQYMKENQKLTPSFEDDILPSKKSGWCSII